MVTHLSKEGEEGGGLIGGCGMPFLHQLVASGVKGQSLPWRHGQWAGLVGRVIDSCLYRQSCLHEQVQSGSHSWIKAQNEAISRLSVCCLSLPAFLHPRFPFQFVLKMTWSEEEQK